MSAPTTTPIWHRTELEVAADTLAALFQRRVLPLNPNLIAEACRAAHVPVEAFKAAWTRLEQDRWRAPSTATVGTSPPPEPPSPAPAPAGDLCSQCGKPITRRVQRGRLPTTCDSCNTPENPTDLDGRRKAWNRLPDEDDRTCRLCTTTKPITAFPLRTDTGTRRSECIECRRESARHRYAQAERARITLELLDTDPTVGFPCPLCSAALKPGDIVIIDGPVRHSDCKHPTTRT